MTFRETFYNVKELLENRLHDFGLESADASTMGWTTMLSIEQNTRVTINVPMNLTYSDAFLITGTLETSTYSRLNNKTVKLKVGHTVVDTTTTNVNGEYSFTQTPVSTGTHSFQVIFEGTNIHTASASSIVIRTPHKETSVINLDAQSTKHYGDNVILSGTLLTNDGEYIKNASVKYYINNSLISTLTTDNYGVFTTPTRTINSFGNLNARFVYEGDSNYTSVSANQTVDVYQPSLNLTSDKDILSYADNESATITAQLIDDAPTPQELAIPGYNIIFSILTNYTDISNIPTQYGSFAISFKATQGTFDIVGDITNYEKSTVTIPNNNASQFKLVWSSNNMRLYQDGNYLQNNVTDIYGVDDTYEGSYANFENNNGITFSDIYIEDSKTTDNTGKATFTYDSQGIGDVTISANIEGSLVIETYSIEDNWLYKTSIPAYSRTIITSNIYKYVFNSPINLPSEFEFELDFKQSVNNNFITVMVGETSKNFYYNGFGNNKQLTMGISRNNNRSSLVDDSRTGLVTDAIKIGYDGTQMYCTANNHTITNNNSEFNLEKFLGLLWGGYSTIHSIKIKKL